MLRIDYVPLDEVVQWPRNPKDHDLPQLQQSLDRFGFTSPLIMDESTGKLVAGHGRLEALRLRREEGEPPPGRIKEENGQWMVPVVRGVELGDEAEAYLLADNRISEAGGWKLSELSQMLQDLDDQGVGLSGLGWEEYELEPLLAAEWTPPEATASLQDFQRDDGEGRGGGHTIKLTAEQWVQIRPLFDEARARSAGSSDGEILVALISA